LWAYGGLGSCTAHTIAGTPCEDSTCAPGELAVDFTDNEIWCRPPDGGADTIRSVDSCYGYVGDPWLPGPTVGGHTGNGYTARADVAGHVALRSMQRQFVFTAPRTDHLMRIGTRRWMTSPDKFSGTPSDHWSEQPGVGFVLAPLDLIEPATGFDFAPAIIFGDQLDQAFAGTMTSAAINGNVYDVSSGALSLSATFDLASGTPTFAVVDGQTVVAAFGDRLVAGPLDGGELTVRIAPRAFDPIVSLAMNGGDGYALTGTALFHVVEHSLQQWTADEVTVPDGQRLGVWLDGTAGRVGYSDGTVLSLPSRVTLSQPLPGGDVVMQYAQLCGQPVALTQGGLYRLGADGTWKTETLPSVGPDRTFDAGRIDTEGDSLLISTGGGTLVRLAPPMSCP
jgi:hypothetical protein